MSSSRHYDKAPITEAIIDFRVTLPEETSVDSLKEINKEHEKAYPTTRKIKLAHTQMQFGEDLSTATASHHIGFKFVDDDEKQIYQARLDGFTMSRLAPYESWAPFRDEARRLWNIYKAAAKPRKLVRVAIRYINRIDIPLPLRDFKDYLRTVPEVSPELSQELDGYFMRLVLPLKDINSQCLVNEAIIEPVDPNVVSVALDIDVFRTEDLPSEEDEIWEFFEILRDRKNMVFEACITDKARELFE